MAEWLVQFAAHALHVIAVGEVQDFAAVFSIAFLTEFGIPFPLMLDTVLFLLGYQIGDLWTRTIAVILILLAARAMGSSILFWLSHYLGHPLIHALGRRFPASARRLEGLATRLGLRTSFAVAISRLTAQVPVAGSGLGFRAPVSIALSRLTPGLLTLTSIASGTLRFRYKYFILGIGAASIFSDLTVTAFGTITGYGLRTLTPSPPAWLLVAGIAINLLVALAIQRLLWRHANGRSPGQEQR